MYCFVPSLQQLNGPRGVIPKGQKLKFYTKIGIRESRLSRNKLGGYIEKNGLS